MSDNELREAWASNFTRRRTDHVAQTICKLICQIISVRAQTSTVTGSDAEKVRAVCSVLGVPVEEYEAVAISKADHQAVLKVGWIFKQQRFTMAFSDLHPNVLYPRFPQI